MTDIVERLDAMDRPYGEDEDVPEKARDEIERLRHDLRRYIEIATTELNRAEALEKRVKELENGRT